MRRSKLIVTICLVCFASQLYGIGISPGRRTFHTAENGSLNAQVGYYLIRPQERYSAFKALTAAGLDTSVTGCSSTNGIQHPSDGSLLIDWDAADITIWDGRKVVEASININTPAGWVNPAVAGGSRYLDTLVQHIEVEDPGGINAILAVSSQLALYRNYALRGEVTNLQNSYSANSPVQLDVEITDYTNYSVDYLPRRDSNPQPSDRQTEFGVL